MSRLKETGENETICNVQSLTGSSNKNNCNKICFVENWRNLNIDPLLDIIESILSFLDGLVDYLHSWEIYALGDVYRRKV